MGTTPLTYQETFALVRELNSFADNMDKKIGALQSSYSTGKAAMLKKHSQSISTFDSNSASAIGSIKAKSKALLADAEKMQRDILALDEQLSAVDKYYVKTKKKKETQTEPTVQFGFLLAQEEGLDSRRELRGSVFRGSDSPPDCHSLPLPFEPSQNCIPAKRTSPRKTWTLSFWQGREDSNPRPTVLELL